MDQLKHLVVIKFYGRILGLVTDFQSNTCNRPITDSLDSIVDPFRNENIDIVGQD